MATGRALSQYSDSDTGLHSPVAGTHWRLRLQVAIRAVRPLAISFARLVARVTITLTLRSGGELVQSAI